MTLFDVIEVSIANPPTVRVMATGLAGDDADVFVRMAVARRGVETHLYILTPPGKYEDGDTFK